MTLQTRSDGEIPDNYSYELNETFLRNHQVTLESIDDDIEIDSLKPLSIMVLFCEQK